MTLPKKKSMVLDLGSARAAGIARATLSFFLDGMVRTIRKKIKSKKIGPRARTRFQNRTDPNPYSTARSPKPCPGVAWEHLLQGTPTGSIRFGHPGDTCSQGPELDRFGSDTLGTPAPRNPNWIDSVRFLLVPGSARLFVDLGAGGVQGRANLGAGEGPGPEEAGTRGGTRRKKTGTSKNQGFGPEKKRNRNARY